ncbi:hypothetical protein B1A85_05445 [Chroococcidiopsis sp. TS-821]|nr:hypothetical protein B1A85_05445 [Chroococcidiopsis sp. TS-821]
MLFGDRVLSRSQSSAIARRALFLILTIIDNFSILSVGLSAFPHATEDVRTSLEIDFYSYN